VEGGGGQPIPAHHNPPKLKDALERLLSDPNICKNVHNNRVINDKKRLGKRVNPVFPLGDV